MSICVVPIHETSLRRSGIARIVKGYHSFTCTPCVSSASGMSYTCLCLARRSWYSFTDPGWMEGSVPWCEVAPVGIPNCNLPTTSPALYHTATSAPVNPVVKSHRSVPGVRPTYMEAEWLMYYLHTTPRFVSRTLLS